MTRDRLPFAGIALLLIDGNNLLHRMAGSADAGALRLLLPRLRGAIPTGVRTIVVLDGTPGPGVTNRQQVSAGLEFRYAGRVDADTALLGILAARPFRERHATAVVTDDRALADRVRSAGGVPRRLQWLEALMDAPSGAIGRAAGAATPPRPGAAIGRPPRDASRRRPRG